MATAPLCPAALPALPPRPQLAPTILASRQYTAKVEMFRHMAAQAHPQEADKVREEGGGRLTVVC